MWGIRLSETRRDNVNVKGRTPSYETFMWFESSERCNKSHFVPGSATRTSSWSRLIADWVFPFQSRLVALSLLGRPASNKSNTGINKHPLRVLLVLVLSINPLTFYQVITRPHAQGDCQELMETTSARECVCTPETLFICYFTWVPRKWWSHSALTVRQLTVTGWEPFGFIILPATDLSLLCCFNSLPTTRHTHL